MDPKPDIVESFQLFSVDHSWYKRHGPFQVYAIPMTRVYNKKDDNLRWYIFQNLRFLEMIDDPVLRKTVEANSATVNPLVFGLERGIRHTVNCWGDQFFPWLLRMDYVLEHDYIQKCYNSINDNNVVIKTLRQKERARMLQELDKCTSKIWYELQNAGYTMKKLSTSLGVYCNRHDEKRRAEAERAKSVLKIRQDMTKLAISFVNARALETERHAWQDRSVFDHLGGVDEKVPEISNL